MSTLNIYGLKGYDLPLQITIGVREKSYSKTKEKEVFDLDDPDFSLPDRLSNLTLELIEKGSLSKSRDPDENIIFEYQCGPWKFDLGHFSGRLLSDIWPDKLDLNRFKPASSVPPIDDVPRSR